VDNAYTIDNGPFYFYTFFTVVFRPALGADQPTFHGLDATQLDANSTAIWHRLTKQRQHKPFVHDDATADLMPEGERPPTSGEGGQLFQVGRTQSSVGRLQAARDSCQSLAVTAGSTNQRSTRHSAIDKAGTPLLALAKHRQVAMIG